MITKMRIWFLLIFCLAGLATKGYCNILSKTDTTYRMIVKDYYFSSYSNGNDQQNYIVLVASIVNYSNDTLKYWGTSCAFDRLFKVTGSPDLQLTDDNCDSPSFEKMIIPPQRSQRIYLKLKMIKQPVTDVTMNVSMVFYKWSAINSFNPEKAETGQVLSDKITMGFNKNGQPYSGPSDFKEKEKKAELMLPTADLYILTDADRKLYTLSIDQNKISMPIDTIDFGKKCKIVHVPVVLHNNSNYTLNYFSMTCSWIEYYHLYNKNLSFPGFVCDKNIPCTITVLPHKSTLTVIPVTFSQTDLNFQKEFRIGMNLNKDVSFDPFVSDFEQLWRYNLIWSNKVLLPEKK